MPNKSVLVFTEPEKWYMLNDFLEVLKVKERRIRILLTELVEQGDLITDGSTKGKKYKKA